MNTNRRFVYVVLIVILLLVMAGRVFCSRAVCGACFCRAFRAAGGLYRYALLSARGYPFRP